MIRMLMTLFFSGLCAVAVAQLPAVDPQIKARLLTQLRAQLAAEGVHATSGPLQVHHDASESLRIGADQVSVVVATTNDDGTLDTQCVRGVDAAAAVLATVKP